MTRAQMTATARVHTTAKTRVRRTTRHLTYLYDYIIYQFKIARRFKTFQNSKLYIFCRAELPKSPRLGPFTTERGYRAGPPGLVRVIQAMI